ncbi:OmpW/AlkL family protein [Paraburkholderia sediminicola]|uniref:OmpW/AlkL family protein n=1 Tax=Paraburkholderia sediminicola TaxID=458836 RepID=UPI0038BCC99D
MYAQSAGNTVASFGWVHISPISSSDPLTVTSIAGHPVNEPKEGTGADATNADTVGVGLEHYFTDNIGVSMLGGYPTYMNLKGSGTLASYGVLGKGRPWSPQLIFNYHFMSADSKFRPFAGIGVAYTWYTNAKITNQSFVTSLVGPGGSASAKASSSWDPVFQVGANYRFAQHWTAGVTVMYIPTSTNLTLTARTATGTEIVANTKVRVRPIITFLNVAYIF